MMKIDFEGRKKIDRWQDFSRIVRKGDYGLLSKLDDFPKSVLVTGCQRSGTTIVSRIITQSDGMVNFWFGKDDELDAALILSGYVNHKCEGRYCFQTTYMYNDYDEYFQNKKGHKIIWVLRNPYSVVYSMLFNWKRFALNELFSGCGLEYLDDREQWMYNKLGALGIGRTKKACIAYKSKMHELRLLQEHYGNKGMIVVDYDDLVKNKLAILPKIYDFIDLKYVEQYSDKLHSSSVVKHKKLSKRQKQMIKNICEPLYEESRALISRF